MRQENNGMRESKGKECFGMQYYMPTKVKMGTRIVREETARLASFGKKALVVTGRHSAKACGALADVTAVLEENGQEYALFDEVMNNPTIDCVYRGASAAREEQADFVIAIGGGSPMDAAKAIAMLAKNEVAREDLFSGNYPDGALPMVHIPTTAGTGSEVTQYAILTNDAGQTKTSMAADCLFPDVALLDAAYLEKLPFETLLYTVVDALSHGVEGMLTKKANPFSDTLAHESIRLFARELPALESRVLLREDYERLLRASTLAGMVIANTGTSVVHTMGYSFTYFKNVAHGHANGLLLGAFLEIAEKQIPGRIHEILTCLGMKEAHELTECLGRLLVKKPEVSEEELELYVKQASGSKKIRNGLVSVDETKIRKIFRTAL